MKRINTRTELIELAEKLGMRPDWHEPDEQDVTATVKGTSFDNAGFWPKDRDYPASIVEEHVILEQGGKPVAAVNLATLFAWAAGPKEALTPSPELKRAAQRAEQAHRDLYDEDLGRGWRQGPGPMRLADFFTALAESGILQRILEG